MKLQTCHILLFPKSGCSLVSFDFKMCMFSKKMKVSRSILYYVGYKFDPMDKISTLAYHVQLQYAKLVKKIT